MVTPDFTGLLPGTVGRGKTHAFPGLQPVRATARLAGDGRLTVGSYADGQPAGWQLTDPDTGRAHHVLIVGAASSGTTTLLRSILDAVAAAGAGVQVIDVDTAGLGLGLHDTACDLTTAQSVLVKHLHVTYERLADRDHAGPWPLRVLAINSLHQLTGDALFTQALATLARLSPKAGIAVLATTRDATIGGCGGELTRSLLAAHSPVLLRTDRRDAQLPGADAAGEIPARLPDGTSTAGIGYLPRQRPGVPFRVWMP